MQKPQLAQVLPTHPHVTWEDGRPLVALGFRKSGAPIWPFRGGAPDDDPPKDPPADDKKFTQAELDAINTRTRDQAERSARKKLLEDMGLPEDAKPEDVKASLQKAKDADRASLSEAERKLAEAEEIKTAAEKEREAGRAERHQLRVAELLAEAGAGDDGIEPGKRTAEESRKREANIARAAKLIDAEVGSDSDKIRSVIADLKKDMPSLFAAPTTEAGGAGGGGGGNQNGRYTGPPAGQSGSKTAAERGKEKAKSLGWVKDKAS